VKSAVGEVGSDVDVLFFSLPWLKLFRSQQEPARVMASGASLAAVGRDDGGETGADWGSRRRQGRVYMCCRWRILGRDGSGLEQQQVAELVPMGLLVASVVAKITEKRCFAIDCL
jgi:hypothetical protein